MPAPRTERPSYRHSSSEGSSGASDAASAFGLRTVILAVPASRSIPSGPPPPWVGRTTSIFRRSRSSRRCCSPGWKISKKLIDGRSPTTSQTAAPDDRDRPPTRAVSTAAQAGGGVLGGVTRLVSRGPTDRLTHPNFRA